MKIKTLQKLTSVKNSKEDVPCSCMLPAPLVKEHVYTDDDARYEAMFHTGTSERQKAWKESLDEFNARNPDKKLTLGGYHEDDLPFNFTMEDISAMKDKRDLEAMINEPLFNEDGTPYVRRKANMTIIRGGSEDSEDSLSEAIAFLKNQEKKDTILKLKSRLRNPNPSYALTQLNSDDDKRIVYFDGKIPRRLWDVKTGTYKRLKMVEGNDYCYTIGETELYFKDIDHPANVNYFENTGLQYIDSVDSDFKKVKAYYR